MGIMHVEPAFASDIDRFFEGLLGAHQGSRMRRFAPPMDLIETDEALVLRADLPGLDESDIDIEIKDRLLTISGERSDELSDDAKGFYRFERAFGAFSRTLRLPEGIDVDAVKAAFAKGVLTVAIPKPEERKPRKVAIGAGDGEVVAQMSAGEQSD